MRTLCSKVLVVKYLRQNSADFRDIQMLDLSDPWQRKNSVCRVIFLKRREPEYRSGPSLKRLEGRKGLSPLENGGGDSLNRGLGREEGK